jgi:deoxyribose-phosphate aldolase
LLQAIAAREAARPETRGRVGFKPAGGVRTVADAGLYMGLVAGALGAAAVTPQRFRLGASGLLGDIEAVLAGRAASENRSAY